MDQDERALLRLEALRVVAAIVEGNAIDMPRKTPTDVLAMAHEYSGWVLTGDLPQQ